MRLTEAPAGAMAGPTRRRPIAGDRAGAGDVAAILGDGATTVLIRRGEGPALLGCIAVEMGGEARCTISMLAVAPQRQARLGRGLLADAEAYAASRRIGKITVVEQREALIAWYERRGYRRTGLEAFPYGDASVGTPLRDDLRFVVEKALQAHALPQASR